jgi:Arc/MetJ family transcription regulator
MSRWRAGPMCGTMCELLERPLPTNLSLDDDLIEEAVKLGHHATKREAVNEALREYVAYRRRIEATTAFGTIEFDPLFDYKLARHDRSTA